MRLSHIHDPAKCACGADPAPALGRRRFLRGVGATALLAALPLPAGAAEGSYEAMILACIDPRFQSPVYAYAAQRGLTGRYSQFVIAGAAVGVVAPGFSDWHKAFWDNLAVSAQLHRITRVIAINHRDCGAAAIAYGRESIADPAKETEAHRQALALFRQEVGRRQPGLAVETGLMALDGSIMMFS